MPVTQNPLIAFQQFGFKLDHENSSGHAVGNCPFCGKAGHFSIKKDHPNKVWDCKRCGRGGGFQKFLQMIVEVSTEKPDLSDLAEQRGLKEQTLLDAGVGIMNGSYTVPVLSFDSKTVLNIKIYDGESFRNTAGCTAAMYGLWLIPKKDTMYQTVYIAEGEWDALAIREMLELTKEKGSIVLGVPGAGTFKQEAVQYFIGKRVYTMYDNDLAGRNGTKKSVQMLSTVSSKIDVLEWPEGSTAGYDVRDVYVKQFKKSSLPAMLWLKNHCKEISAQGQDTSVDPGICTPPVPVQEVYKVFKRWVHIGDNANKDQRGTDIYDVVFGTILANRIPGSPVWLYVVAPPGGFKTEPLLACSGGKLIEMVESVTPPALISGMNVGGHDDPSLIGKINGKTLIIKDWTIILGLPEHERNEIMSILRGAFDGICGRNFGNGVRREIKSTFGILAAVTPVIEQFIEQTSAVGERFISWRNWLSEDLDTRKGHIRQALENSMSENDMKSELNTIAKKVLIAKYPEPPRPSQSVTEQIISMSEWVSAMRCTVTRDKYSKAITHRPCTELGTRLSKEILKWCMGAALFRGENEISLDIMRIAQHIARSSVSPRNLAIISFMYKDYNKSYTKKELSDAIKLPDETTDTLLGNMVALSILERVLVDNKPTWKIKTLFKLLTDEAKVL